MGSSPFIYRARCDRVVDADTIDLEIDLGFSLVTKQRIRLLEIDAPEMYGLEREAGELARDFVEQWIIAAAGDDFDLDLPPFEWPLVVWTSKADSFGRYLGNIRREIDGEYLGEALIESGLADFYER